MAETGTSTSWQKLVLPAGRFPRRGFFFCCRRRWLPALKQVNIWVNYLRQTCENFLADKRMLDYCNPMVGGVYHRQKEGDCLCFGDFTFAWGFFRRLWYFAWGRPYGVRV